MTKQELLSLLRLLSALECAGLMRVTPPLPDYLYEQIEQAVRMLEREIMK